MAQWVDHRSTIILLCSFTDKYVEEQKGVLEGMRPDTSVSTYLQTRIFTIYVAINYLFITIVNEKRGRPSNMDKYLSKKKKRFLKKE